MASSTRRILSNSEDLEESRVAALSSMKKLSEERSRHVFLSSMGTSMPPEDVAFKALSQIEITSTHLNGGPHVETIRSALDDLYQKNPFPVGPPFLSFDGFMLLLDSRADVREFLRLVDMYTVEESNSESPESPEEQADAIACRVEYTLENIPTLEDPAHEWISQEDAARNTGYADGTLRNFRSDGERHADKCSGIDHKGMVWRKRTPRDHDVRYIKSTLVNKKP